MAQNPILETFVNEGTPLMIGGVLYVSTSLSQVAAIDAATGQTIWTHDPEVWRLGTPPNHGFVHRGVGTGQTAARPASSSAPATRS